jgi:hypothetical protein
MSMSDTRTQVDAILQTLKQQLAAPGHDLTPLLSTMSRFGHYSLSNQFLIFAQRPNATRVLGFHGWRNAGYRVRKGEKGIAIYAPMRFRTDDDAITDAASTDATEPKARIGYRVAWVFDISQVEPLNPATTTATTTDAPSHAASVTAELPHLSALRTLITAQGLTLTDAAMSPGQYGFTDGQTITLATDLTPADTFSTLIHEYAHAKLHFDGTPRDLTTRETEAEAVAYVVCSHLDVPNPLSVRYIRAYRGNPDTLQQSLHRIRDLANALLTAVMPAVAAVPEPAQH